MATWGCALLVVQAALHVLQPSMRRKAPCAMRSCVCALQLVQSDRWFVILPRPCPSAMQRIKPWAAMAYALVLGHFSHSLVRPKGEAPSCLHCNSLRSWFADLGMYCMYCCPVHAPPYYLCRMLMPLCKHCSCAGNVCAALEPPRHRRLAVRLVACLHNRTAHCIDRHAIQGGWLGMSPCRSIHAAHCLLVGHWCRTFPCIIMPQELLLRTAVLNVLFAYQLCTGMLIAWVAT